MRYSIVYFFVLLILVQCSSNEIEKGTNAPLFESMDASRTNIDFVNELNPTEEFNMYIFRNFYNGGGVAVGDVSGNGLPDILLTGNMISNRLYINHGDFTFVDVTDQAGLNSDGYWSTGASMADVNGDGLLDIYVTLSGRPSGEERHNRLYINNGDRSENNDGSGLTFTESAKEYNLMDDGLSTHGVFFDYNGDNLLDLYLISNSFHEVGGYDNVTGSDRQIPDPRGASKLYRNEGDTFTDVTQEAGIYSSIIGFGLSTSVGDLNRDGLPDLYVANDFFERDYLYINNGDGTFTESLERRIRSMSFSSMGSDIADLNNDGWPEIYVTDMLPANEKRLKSKMTIESWEEYQNNVSRGFHHKFTRNTLQWNRGDGTFSEIGRYANVFATDWSWATLIADFNNSGRNDIFVANGIYKDLLDQDYIEKVSNPRAMQQMIQSGEENVILNLMDQMSSTPLSNFAFRNEGGFHFTNQTESWGLEEPGFSTGAAWADFDNDGDLDLITNDVNGSAKIYRNRSEELSPDKNWLKVQLKGEGPNTYGIGAQLQVWAGDKYWFREHYLQRGFQSSVEPGLHLGLGSISKIDSLEVRWPNGWISRKQNISVPSTITIEQTQSAKKENKLKTDPAIFSDSYSVKSTDYEAPLLQEVEIGDISGWRHEKFEYSDFSRERLMPHMRSTEGPAFCVGDVNGDERTDMYFGGARDQAGALWVQQEGGQFNIHQPGLFEADAISEDIDCSFFDATGNGLDDLYVVSGGNSFSSGSSALSDRFYRNDGNGRFQKSSQILPTTRGFEPGSVVAPYDFTKDGILDLFVGIRLKPFAVGVPVNGYLLEGDGEGRFTDITDQFAPLLLDFGMITDAVWADLTGDDRSELIIAGEWMPIRIFQIEDDKLTEVTEQFGLSEISGWWNTLDVGDVNGDGRADIIAANHGTNSQFNPELDSPLKMFVGDFSMNGMIDQIIASSKNGEYCPVALRNEVIEVVPSLAEKYPTYASYAGKSVKEIFSPGQLEKATTQTAAILKSAVFLNTPDGMKMEELPPRAQLSPMYAIEIIDLGRDQKSEIVMGGNLYDVKPQIGPYDASRGVVISYRDGFQTLPASKSGLNITGEIRHIERIDIEGIQYLIIVRYDDTPIFLKVVE